MKASELRIGNYVYANKKVREISHSDISEIVHETIVPKYINEYKPIPLTEEWLVKFGFEKWEAKFNMGSSSQPMSGWVNGKFNLYKSYQGITHEQHISTNNLICKYVHQLQNLYFALIGKELTFKLE
jgi:hypothetical protein